MRTLLTALLAGMIVLLVPAPAQAQHGGGAIGKHIIAQGETLYSIARKYCMTPEELHAANRGVIGNNPDMLRVGMVLSVRDLCGGGMDDDWSQKPKPEMGGGGGFPYETAEEYLDQFEVWDRGPRKHAMGLLNGMYYIVAPNDTLFSITQRFGIAESTLQKANGIHKTRYLSAGAHLYIPGLDTSRAVCKGGRAYVTIDAPADGTTVDATFTVRGRGCGLFENNVIVRALRADGTQLVQRAVTLQDTEAGSGKEGSYSTQLTISGYTGPGRIEVFNVESDARDDVNVIFIGPIEERLTITSPADNATLLVTFTVNVSTENLANQIITIAAVSSSGSTLASTTRAITSNAQSVSVQLTVNVAGSGRIEAYGPDRDPIDSVPVRFGGQPPFIQLTAPADNASLSTTFTVSGRGRNLVGNQVMIRALRADGTVLRDGISAILSDINAEGDGTFSLALTISDYAGLGTVEAYNTTSNVSDSASNVRFGGITSPTPVPTATPGTAWLTIDAPLPDSTLPARFMVSGRGRGLFEGNVVVRAFNTAGLQLAEATTVLQGATVGTGGEGTYAVELTVNTSTRGYIVVSGPQSAADPKSVNVGFNGASTSGGTLYRDFLPGECRAVTLPGTTAYPQPVSGTGRPVESGLRLDAVRVIDPAGIRWYAFDENLAGASMYSWIEAADLELAGDCALQ